MKLSGAFVVMLAAWPIATAVPFRMVDKLAPIRRGEPLHLPLNSFNNAITRYLYFA
jgi:hypothetical protein